MMRTMYICIRDGPQKPAVECNRKESTFLTCVDYGRVRFNAEKFNKWKIVAAHL
jgi:hypothetical protein